MNASGKGALVSDRFSTTACVDDGTKQTPKRMSQAFEHQSFQRPNFLLYKCPSARNRIFGKRASMVEDSLASYEGVDLHFLFDVPIMVRSARRKFVWNSGCSRRIQCLTMPFRCDAIHHAAD
jgi:hypothetical protein